MSSRHFFEQTCSSFPATPAKPRNQWLRALEGLPDGFRLIHRLHKPLWKC
jgi:hypothetical protein